MGMGAPTGVTWARQLARGETQFSPMATAVARVLGDHANASGRCMLLQKTIAAEAGGICERSVRNGLDELRRGGVLRDHQTRGASVFVLVLAEEPGTRCRPAAQARHEVPASPAPGADRRGVLEEKPEEVNLFQGANGDGARARVEQDHHPSTRGIQHPLLAAAKPDLDADQAERAHRCWLILKGGFDSIPEPAPTWRHPTEPAVIRELERLGWPGAVIEEQAAREARVISQRRNDGSNVVGLFAHVLAREKAKLAGVHRRVEAGLA